MTKWLQWTAPVMAVASIASPAYAIQFVDISEAQKQAFPTATRFVEQGGRVWEAQAGDKAIGTYVVDRVVGKHLFIDYAVSLDPGGRVRRVEILQYRESYGGEVKDASWLSQFVGKTSASPLTVGQDIRNISGATLSSRHVTEGVKRIVNAYAKRTR